MKEKFMNGMLAVATTMNGQRHLAAIRNSFMNLLPIIIIGSFCTLFTNVVTSTKEGFMSIANIPGMGFLENIQPMFTAANYATMNFLAIGIVILLANELGESYGIKDKGLPLIALGAYISLCATTIVITSSGSGEAITVSNILSSSYTNAQGLFVGMFSAIAATEIYCRLVKSKKLAINMPDSVPANVARSFEILFPAAITILAISGIGMVFEMIVGMSLFDAIAKFVQAPLSNVLTGLPGFMFFVFMTTLLWIFGIHGTQTLKAVSEPILIAALAQNEAAYAAGQAIPNIISRPFLNNYAIVTGAGVTGGLLIAIFLFSKRKDYRTIGKLAIPCGIFNINEPLIFGLPIVLNPLLAIPFMLTPVITSAFAYFMTSIGFAGRLVVNAPWTTPLGIQAFLASGGSIGAVVTQILVVLISAAIYTPFILAANRQAENDEVEEVA
ncbi:PTS sugar transporter subunit IIC [Sporosalibacterium faouarense]|uniref:PTS sugar transporter subunit IIC n=1 Tax=Sporosalibacterium faouarense TaxID=516123 RepID=UPI00141C69D2|nr:PTS transporter subunit EIIC [Sporosalibacterium faouarense]MTI49311.1 PTS sugar transporter subunit IIC [Bacillota bacterium]